MSRERRRTNASIASQATPNLVGTSFGRGKHPPIQQPDRTYKQSWCAKPSAAHPKSLVFKASFEKPLEEMIYPSLQLVDNNKQPSSSFNMCEEEEEDDFFDMSDSPDLKSLLSDRSMRPSTAPDADSNGQASPVGSHILPRRPIRLRASDTDKAKNCQVAEKWSVEVAEKHKTQREVRMEVFLGSMKQGESYLRNQLRSSRPAARAAAKALASANEPVAAKVHVRTRKKNILSASYDQKTSPEYLYQSLSVPPDHPTILERLKAKQEAQANSDSGIYSTEQKIVRNIRESSKEEEDNSVYEKNSDQLANGILSYRFNQKIKEDTDKNEKDEIARIALLSRIRNGSHHIKRTSGRHALLSNMARHVSAFGAVQENEEEGSDEGSDFDSDNEKEELGNLTQQRLDNTDPSRIRRAIRSKFVGYEYPEVMDVKEVAINQSPSLDSRSPNRKTIFDDDENSVTSQSIETLTSTTTIKVDFSKSAGTAEGKRRYAQDVLLLSQIKAGILPEQFIKSNSSSSIDIDLSHYGIGDDHGVCFGQSLIRMTHSIHSIGLRNNRLTNISVPTIVNNVSRTLVCLDLSQNDLHGHGSHALASFFIDPTSLEYLDISSCKLKCNDICLICSALVDHENCLTSFFVAGNNIDSTVAVSSLADLVAHPSCSLTDLDLSYNKLSVVAGGIFAVAVGDNNTLVTLNVSANCLSDIGAQSIATSLLKNKSLENVIVTHNAIGGKACFVFARALESHEKMKKLDLSNNPLSEEGACSLFRIILSGLSCFVVMKDCALSIDSSLFEFSYPANRSPYTLDVSNPYDMAVLHELKAISRNENSACSFGTIDYSESSRRTGLTMLDYSTSLEQMVLAGSSSVWQLPLTGVITASFQQFVAPMPTLNMAISDKALTVVKIIIIKANSLLDRKKWLRMLFHNALCTTKQIQTMIDEFVLGRYSFLPKNEKKTVIIGSGELTRVDIVASVWSKLLDTANKYDFLCHNLNKDERSQLTSILSLELYRFNWMNPTGHWRIDLCNKYQRNVMMQIIAKNRIESHFSKNTSRRGDTSQKGNWSNFRNEKLNEVTDIAIDDNFMNNIPLAGRLEFDYVSTTRPTSLHTTTISKEDMDDLKLSLGLDDRHRLSKMKTLTTLIELQIASSKYWFSVANVLNMMYTFSDDALTQSKVIICLFSRIHNIWDFDIIMRQLARASALDVVKHLGWLNIMNPLKPSYAFELPLLHFDNRMLLNELFELASAEGGTNLTENENPELTLVYLYGRKSQLSSLDCKFVETVKVQYANFGSRVSEDIQWNYRKEMMKKFLVGTYPFDNNAIYQVISMYNEMEAAGTLTKGPIDCQYKAHLKAPKMKSRFKKLLERRGLGRGQGSFVDTVAAAKNATNEDADELTASPTLNPANRKSSTDNLNSRDE